MIIYNLPSTLQGFLAGGDRDGGGEHGAEAVAAEAWSVQILLIFWGNLFLWSHYNSDSLHQVTRAPGCGWAARTMVTTASGHGSVQVLIVIIIIIVISVIIIIIMIVARRADRVV